MLITLKRTLVVGVLLLLLPSAARAQVSAGAIAGLVKDATGGVLPGVTVEASSPALIEKTRSVVTDSDGRYKIDNLRPGTYTVTCSLVGFNSVKREGIELTTGFTANVNVELKVGSLEETITVTGETPVVDVQNTKQQAVLSRDVIDTIPTGKMYQNLGVLVPGVQIATKDVGGLSGQTYQGMSLHGGRTGDQQLQVEGMPTYNWVSLASTAYVFTEGNFQEVVMDVGGQTAETEGGGVRINMIPKDGGNQFHGQFTGSYTPKSLQPNNLDDALRARHLTSVSTLKEQYNANPGFGGPIVSDKLWFYGSFMQQRNEQYVPNQYYNACPACWTYTADLTRPAFKDQLIRDESIRLTWQATPRNKWSMYYGHNLDGDYRFFGSSVTNNRTEAVITQPGSSHFFITSWQSPLTSHLLFEAGFATSPALQPFRSQPESVAPEILDSGLNINYRGAGTGVADWHMSNPEARGAVSYVTGTHAVKVGWTNVWGEMTRRSQVPFSLTYQALNGVPTGVTYYTDPFLEVDVPTQGAVFAQDQWSVRRFTLSGAVRYDYYKGSTPEQDNPATAYAAARNIAPIKVVRWNDVSPRLGVAYDVFGNGKTAIKGSVSRFVVAEGVSTIRAINPIINNNSNPRKWTDGTGGPADLVVQGDPLNPLANQELGPSTNLKFGQPQQLTRVDPAFGFAFNTRPANWEFSASVQQQLAARISVNAAFFRRQFINLAATQNQAVSPNDYDSYCVTAPVDARLPTSGQQICGLFDLKSTAVGKIDDVRTSASKFGHQDEHWSGFDFTVVARPKNTLLQGGVSVGKQVFDDCSVMTGHPDVVVASNTPGTALTASPRTGAQYALSQQFCHAESPWLADVKLVGSYTLPAAVQLSGTYQDAPGPSILATGTFTNAQVQGSLGRPLGAASTVTVGLLPFGALYGPRLHQIDFRVARNFTIGRQRFQPQVDFYNLANANVVTGLSSVYGATTGAAQGSAWQVPQAILTARIVKFGILYTF